MRPELSCSSIPTYPLTPRFPCCSAPRKAVLTVNGKVPDSSGNVNVGDIRHDDFAGMERKEGMTLREVGGKTNELIARLKGAVVVGVLSVLVPAYAGLTPDTEFGDVPPDTTVSKFVSVGGYDPAVVHQIVDSSFTGGTGNVNRVVGTFDLAVTRVSALESSKADKPALNAHINNKDNPHAVTAEQVGAVPLVEDYEGNKTAVTIGNRASNVPVGGHSLANGKNVTALGDYSHAEGDETSAHGMYSHAEGAATTASGDYSHAEGFNTTASGDYSHAEGINTTASGDYSHAEGSNTTALGDYSHAGGALSRANDAFSYTWNGDILLGDNPYQSHGPSTFNINPAGGLDGFWIGEQTLYAILTNKADKADISSTNPTFSDAVLAVGLNIDTNSVAVLNEIASTFGGFPIEGTATTVGALLAALAAAAAWLKKNKVQTLKLEDNSVETSAENGVAKLDDFFTESNSLLTGTIDARLPYPLYTVPSTGLLKDRAINTTSLASVTVPDNFTDLLIRASVASSLSVTMPEATTKYGDTFPGEAGEYLITITKTGAAEAYVRTIKLEEVA